MNNVKFNWNKVARPYTVIICHSTLEAAALRRAMVSTEVFEPSVYRLLRVAERLRNSSQNLVGVRLMPGRTYCVCRNCRDPRYNTYLDYKEATL